MRRRHRFDIYWVLILAVVTIGYFSYSNATAASRGVENYSSALKEYKAGKYEQAFIIFGKVPYNSGLKQAALFRQARCATNLDKKPVAIKKYKKIIHSNSKTSIVPISQYNMACLMYEIEDKSAKGYFKKIIKHYPSSDYAVDSYYYLGMIMKNEALTAASKRQTKLKEQALLYFKKYIENLPGGRFSMNAVNEITALGLPLKNYDNLLIAKSYYASGEYSKAKEYFNKTTLSESWTDFAKNEYKLGNTDKVKEYTEKGLKEFAMTSEPKDIYEVIDNYISLFPIRKDGINSLSAMNIKSTGADYIAYLNCNEVVPANTKVACFSTFYEHYPNGQFSAEALYNVFLQKYLQKKYYDAQKLGLFHIKKFPNVKSSPAVMYYMGKIAFKLKHYESASGYYKKVINTFPDSYYAYRANHNLNKEDGFLPFLDIQEKRVVFPYRKSLDNNLVVNLALLKDYDLVEELCKKDKFIQSWIAYERGDYTVSAVLARNAIEDMEVKPDYDDLRWRLAYPLHYYNIVEKVKGENNPIILESIIKEESHFNPYAKSSAGAEGLMQLMPQTYSEVIKKNNIPQDLSAEVANIAAGSLYYASLKKGLLNRDLYAISAYNGGIGSVNSWFTKLIYNDTDEFVEQIPYPETKNYVKKVLRTYWVYGNIYK